MSKKKVEGASADPGEPRRLDSETQHEARKRELYKELAELGEPVPEPYKPHAPQEYPKMLYGADGAQTVVESADEEAALEGDWSTTPPAKDGE